MLDVYELYIIGIRAKHANSKLQTLVYRVQWKVPNWFFTVQSWLRNQYCTFIIQDDSNIPLYSTVQVLEVSVASAACRILLATVQPAKRLLRRNTLGLLVRNGKECCRHAHGTLYILSYAFSVLITWINDATFEKDTITRNNSNGSVARCIVLCIVLYCRSRGISVTGASILKLNFK
jgi:hypothetical protein